ncbi:MAG: glycosyltransferase family 2 protein [Bacteroidales bacterium]|nr:glycosyltransferase family 2 protein [Bacteroidales bacterium]MCF8404590.1 glycosyltransferase family 2 protein [Bacteroidales bacterium]
MNIVDLVIPAYNEEGSIAKVVSGISKEVVREIVVINNNSSDNTAEIAKRAGATVLQEVRRGYGWACLKGIAHVANKETPPDILVFMDGDYADYPEELPNILQPILKDDMDLVIGSRALGVREKGSMTIPQVFGNWLSTSLMNLIYRSKFTDLGPFRAIKLDMLLALDMQDKTYGWTIEMQIKAVKQKMKCTEVAVNYRKRIGFSKVSGTVKGTLMAGVKIIYLIFKYF